jgi:hypothetical protein
MANDPRKPMYGELHVDATDLVDDTVDLHERARLGMRRAQPGYEVAEAEIVANQPTLGERAGITALTVQEIVDSSARVARIKERLHAARKLVEILEESEAFHDDKRQRLVFGAADSVETQARARGDHELLAKYEQTRAYRSAIAKKAVRTRKRNQENLVDAPADTPAE